MKIKERALSLLLSLVLVLTFMPAMAFAGGDEEADIDGTPAVEETTETAEEIPEAAVDDVTVEVPEGTLVEAPLDADTTPAAGEVTRAELLLTKTSYTELEMLDREWFYGEEYSYYIDFTTGDKIRVYTSDTEWKDYTYSEEDSGDGDYYFKNGDESKLLYSLNYWGEERISSGSYDFETYDETDEIWVTIALTITASDEDEVALSKAKNDAWYTVRAAIDQKYPLCRAAQQDELDAICANAWDSIGAATDVAGVNAALNSLKAKIGAVKTDAQLKVEEQAAAALAAENARQGTSGNLPKVKASKPKAAKKAITVKWKKLKKKQLKSGVSNIEVWVCSDGAFANGSTIEKVVGKKKSSVKIKGLQKGVTYYVKVRAITYSGGTKIVGPWSAVKKVKVKK
jgi:hypothetical protein